MCYSDFLLYHFLSQLLQHVGMLSATIIFVHMLADLFGICIKQYKHILCCCLTNITYHIDAQDKVKTLTLSNSNYAFTLSQQSYQTSQILASGTLQADIHVLTYLTYSTR